MAVLPSLHAGIFTLELNSLVDCIHVWGSLMGLLLNPNINPSTPQTEAGRPGRALIDASL